MGTKAKQASDKKTIPPSVIAVPGRYSGGPQHRPDDGALIWSLDFAQCVFKRPRPLLLTEFVHLWQEPDEGILKFFIEWGPLDLVEDEMKIRRRALQGHRAKARFNSDIVGPALCSEEPIAAWRYLSHRADAVLRLAADLREGELGRDVDWGFLSSEGPSKTAEFFGFPDWSLREPVLDDKGSFSHWGKRIGLISARRLLADEVNAWIERFPFSLTLETQPGGTWGFRVEYFEGCLLSAVAYQLALMVSNSDLFRCTTCGEPYLRPTRRPNAGQANYCGRCARGTYSAALRRADHRRNERMRRARQMHAEGRSPSDIAKELGMTRDTAVKTIQGWIQKGKRSDAK